MFRYLGRLNISLLGNRFGKITTNDVVVTDEREEHIKSHHMEDYALLQQYAESIVEDPDYLIEDVVNKTTVFMIKKLPDTNLNMVVKLVIDSECEDRKNSVMTFYRIRTKNLEKLIKKNHHIYKKI